MRWRRAVPTCPQRGDTVAASLGEKSKRFTCRFYLYDARHTTNNRCHGELFYFFFVKYSNEADPEIFFEKKKNVQHTLTRFQWNLNIGF